PGATITASGGEAPYKFTLWSWHTLPDGLSLDPDTGRISGTPTEVTSKGFYIAATDANGSTAMEYFTMQVGRYPAPVITRAPVSLTVARGGTALFSVEAEGAYQYHWEVKPKGWDIWADHEDHSLSADPTLPIP